MNQHGNWLKQNQTMNNEPYALKLDPGFYKTVNKELERLHKLLQMSGIDKADVGKRILELTKTLGPYLVNQKNDTKN